MSAAHKTILQRNWQSFEAVIIPPDAPQVQRDEMKKAFFAGCTIALGVTFALGNSDLSEEAASLLLEGMREEIEAFAASLPQANDTSQKFNWH